ncbi:MAG: hypothetical protein JKY94_00630 [Rhodobacteraceae bacterium]|nr:hypothetical protein [Paracoccaceae bacterium]
MPKVLLKSVKAYFDQIDPLQAATAEARVLSSDPALNLTLAVLVDVLKNRKVNMMVNVNASKKLSGILHRRLEHVWAGAIERLPKFVARLNALVNVHLPDGKEIRLKIPPITKEATIRELRDMIEEAILNAVHGG